MVAEVEGDSYNLLLVAHLLSVVVGFGLFFVSGAYGVQARARKGRERLAIAEATYDATRWAEWSIYVVPITGILLILVSDDRWKFSQIWISLAFLVYIAILGVLHGAYLPNMRRMNAVLAELADGPGPERPHGAGSTGPDEPASGPPPQAAEADQRARRASVLGGVLNLLVVAALILMVWKPGFP